MSLKYNSDISDACSVGSLCSVVMKYLLHMLYNDNKQSALDVKSVLKYFKIKVRVCSQLNKTCHGTQFAV